MLMPPVLLVLPLFYLARPLLYAWKLPFDNFVTGEEQNRTETRKEILCSDSSATELQHRVVYIDIWHI